MSFSGNVKEELSHHLGSARHCRIAETAAIISICGGVMIDSRPVFFKNSYRKSVSCKKVLYFINKNI